MANNFEITYIPEEKVERSPLGEAARVGVGALARGAEAALGSAGDILKTVGDVGVAAFNKLAGPGPGVPEFFSPLPTSQQLRAGTKYLTGEALEPKSGTEKFAQDIVSDLASLATPIPGLGAGMKLGKAAKTALGANAFALGAEQLGLGEIGQTGAKLGFIVGSSLRGLRPELEALMKNAYTQGEELGKTIAVDVKPLKDIADTTNKYISKGLKTPAKTTLSVPVGEIQDLTHRGNLTAADVWQIKKDVNEILRASSTPDAARGILGKISSKADSILQEASKTHKDFGKLYKDSDSLYKALNVQSDIEKSLEKFFTSNRLGKKLAKTGLKDLSEFSALALRSPAAAKHYAKMAEASLKDTPNLIAKHINAMQKIAKENPELDQFEITSLGE